MPSERRIVLTALVCLIAVLLSGFIFGRMQYGPYWDDTMALATSARIPSAGGTPGYAEFPAGSTTFAYFFDAGNDECLQFALQLPHTYKVGTDVSCHAHWTPTSTNAGSVCWQLSHTFQEIGGTFTGASTIRAEQAGGGVAYAHQVAEFPDIVDAGMGISGIMVATLCRDADDSGCTSNDTYDADAVLLAFDCHIQNDTPGSWAEFTK